LRSANAAVQKCEWYIVGSENCTLAGSAERFDVRVKGSPNRMIVRLSGAPYLVPAAHDVVEVRTRNPQSESKSSVSS